MFIRISALSLMLLSLTAHGRDALKSEIGWENLRRTTIQEDSQSKESALIKSIQKGDVTAVRQLLDAGVNPNSTDDEPAPLFFAILKNNLEIVRLLLDRGVDLKAKVDDDRAALSFAALLGRAEIVDLLIARGADVNAEDDCSNTALREATHGAFIKSQFDFFMRRPEWADVQQEMVGAGEFVSMFGTGHQEVAWLLIAHGAKANVKSCAAGDAGTPLEDAARSGNIALVQLLLSHGADPEEVDISFLAKPSINSEDEIKVDDSESVKESKLESRLENDWWRAKAPERAHIIEMLKQQKMMVKKEPSTKG
jgi:ankyrin repeat protein